MANFAYIVDGAGHLGGMFHPGVGLDQPVKDGTATGIHLFPDHVREAVKLASAYTSLCWIHCAVRFYTENTAPHASSTGRTAIHQ